MAKPITQMEQQLERHDQAIRELARQLLDEANSKRIEDILDGTETSSEDSTGTAD